MAYQVTVFPPEFLGNPIGYGYGRNTARLSAADHFFLPTACFKTHFGNLRGFPGASITGNDHDIVFCDGFYDFIPVGNDREFVRVVYFAGFVHTLRVKSTSVHEIICAMLFTILTWTTHERNFCPM
jgi:hypothetical protein